MMNVEFRTALHYSLFDVHHLSFSYFFLIELNSYKRRLMMSRYYQDNSFSIGKTPLVKLNRISDNGKATILAKIEGRNPAYSVKCRIGASMVWDAEKKGSLKPGMQIVEPTSGNTGIALAFVAAARGYRLTLTMPDTMSIERRKILRAFGANVVLTEGAQGMKGAVAKAEEIVASEPDRSILLQQFTNPANPLIHETTTGPEIWDDTDGEIDALVAGVGTGGTITGISWFIKKGKGKQITSIAVEPVHSPVITQTLKGEALQPGSHKIQGIGAGFIPENLDLSMVDRVELVSNDEAIEFARRLAREEGVLSGISSGAAAAVAVRLGKEEAFSGKTIVVILPDSGERYLSGVLYEGIFDSKTGL
jgi:cysteine synthase A